VLVIVSPSLSLADSISTQSSPHDCNTFFGQEIRRFERNVDNDIEDSAADMRG
jgi:hypothetical protein